MRAKKKEKKLRQKKEKFLQVARGFAFLGCVTDQIKKTVWEYLQAAAEWDKEIISEEWATIQLELVNELSVKYTQVGVIKEIKRCKLGSRTWKTPQIGFVGNNDLKTYLRQTPWQPTAAQTNNSPKNKPSNESPTTAPKTDYKKIAEEHFSQTKKAAEPEKQILTSLQDLEKLAKENNINFETTDKGDLGLNATKLARVLTISNFAGVASDLVKKADKNDFLALCEKQKNNEYPIKAFIALLEFLANHHINRPDAI